MLKVTDSRANSAARGHTRDLRISWHSKEMQMIFELPGMAPPAHELNTDACRRRSSFEHIPCHYCPVK